MLKYENFLSWDKIFKFLEEIVIMNALKSHWKSENYLERSKKDILEYHAEFINAGLKIFKTTQSLDILKMENILRSTNRQSIFRFQSPFKPLTTFNNIWKKEKALHQAWIHYYPNKIANQSSKSKRAIIYIHGWGRTSFRIEELWQFSLIQRELQADIFTIELPYHMHRNPKPQSFSGQGLLDGDPIRTLEGFRQAVIETETLYNGLVDCKIYREGGIGVIGVSLGAHIATMLNLLRNEEIMILAALVGSPFYKNLQKLKISPHFIKSLARPEIRSLLSVLDFNKIEVKHPNSLFRLFGAKYDQLISEDSVIQLGTHLGCPTYLWPIGHFTWPLFFPRALRLLPWAQAQPTMG